MSMGEQAVESNPYQPPTADAPFSPHEGELTDEQRTGRTVLLAHIVPVLLFSIAATGLAALNRGGEGTATGVIRFLLTAALCYWTYRGSVTAARIMMVLLGIGAASGAFLVVRDFGSAPMPLLVALAVMALVYGSFVFVLLASPSVEAFLTQQQRAKTQV